MAHVRRKFFDEVKCGHGFAENAHKAVDYIQKTYFLENRLREKNLSNDEIVAERKKEDSPDFK